MRNSGLEKLPLKKAMDISIQNVFKLTPDCCKLLKIGPNKETYEKMRKQPNPRAENEIISLPKEPVRDQDDEKTQKIREKIKKLLPKSIINIIDDKTPSKFTAYLLGQHTNVSGFLPLYEHANEFKGNNDIKNMINNLGNEKPLFRKIRGDGNCFFRAAVIQYFEKLLEDNIELDKESIAQSRVIIFVKGVLQGKLIKCKLETENLDLEGALKDVDSLKEVLQKNVCEILLEKFVLEKKLKDKNLAYQKLLELIQDRINNVPGLDIALIVFLRSWIQKSYTEHLEEYKNFIYDNSAEEILKTYGLEAENVIIPIVADALECKVIINIVHTDYSTKKTTLLKEEYESLLGKNANKDITLNMYFRPGHYECLYDRGFYAKYYKDIFENI